MSAGPCHPERSEGSLCRANQILRCAQDDMYGVRTYPYMSSCSFCCCAVFADPAQSYDAYDASADKG